MSWWGKFVCLFGPLSLCLAQCEAVGFHEGILLSWENIQRGTLTHHASLLLSGHMRCEVYEGRQNSLEYTS